MTSNNAISRAVVENFIDLIESGMQRKNATEVLGVSIDRIKSAAIRHGIAIPKRIPAIDRIRKFEPQILTGEITQREIARQTGLSQCRVSKIYKAQGWSALPIGGQGRPPVLSLEVRAAQAETLISHLKEHGGYVAPSIKELGLQISRHFFYKYCKDIGFDFRPYRWAGRRYGCWETLPCTPKRITKTDYLLTARCSLCQTVHLVTLVNMKVGSSTMCRACAHTRREFVSVECVETKKIFRSVMNAAKQLGVGYQGLRRKLVKDGQATINGMTYRSIKKIYAKEMP